MNSEKWCSTARKLFTALTVIIVLLVFINAVIQAVALGEQDAGAAVWAFFIYMIGGCLGAAIWWFITRWLIFVLEELVEARKSREKLNKALFESFYREKAGAPVDGYLRFAGKQSLKTNEMLELIAARLAEENGDKGAPHKSGTDSNFAPSDGEEETLL